MSQIWVPALQLGSGADVFTERLVRGLQTMGIQASLQWLPASYGLLPLALRQTRPPAGTDTIICNLRCAAGFRHRGIRLIAVKHDAVGDPQDVPAQTLPQRLYHQVLTQRWEALGLRAADAVVAVSASVADSLVRGYRYDRSYIIPTGVDSSIFHPATGLYSADGHLTAAGARSDPRSDGTGYAAGNKLRILFVGAPSFSKGADLVLPILQRAGANFTLFHTGFSEDLPGWYEIPEFLRARVHALGRLDEAGMVRAYQQADVLLLPSRSEGFSYAVAEAMSCGLPVVATRLSALSGLIEEGVNGLLCPSGDVMAFSIALHWLSDQTAVRARLGQAALARVLQDFELSHCARAYAALAQRLQQRRA